MADPAAERAASAQPAEQTAAAGAVKIALDMAVKGVVNAREANGVRYCKVRYAGRSKADDAWVREDQVTPALLANFRERKAAATAGGEGASGAAAVRTRSEELPAAAAAAGVCGRTASAPGARPALTDRTNALSLRPASGELGLLVRLAKAEPTLRAAKPADLQ